MDFFLGCLPSLNKNDFIYLFNAFIHKKLVVFIVLFMKFDF